MNRYHAWEMAAVVVLSALVLLSGCKNDENQPGEPPSMTIMEAPAFLAANVDSCYTFRVQLAHVEAESIVVEVRMPDGNVHSSFALYDDGSLLPAAPPDYACSHSGDIWASDGQFTRRINARLLADTVNTVTGAYEFRFRAPQIAEQRVTVHIENVEPCLIASATSLGDLAACFAEMPLEVRIRRSANDLVDSVWLAEVTPEPSYFLDPPRFTHATSDTVWTAMLTPTFARCLPTGGPYELEYRARTRFGMACSQPVTIQSFVNSLPSLSSSTLPDTIFHPTAVGDSDSVSFAVDLQDCELAGERYYNGLQYNLRRRDRTEWDTLNYVLLDDGLAPDAIPGDGTYSGGLTIPWFIPDSLYYFRFYAIECAVPYDTSDFLIDSVQIWPQPGIASGRRGQNPTSPTGAHPLVFQ